MSPAKPKRGAKNDEPEMAEPCDLRQLEDPRASAVRRKRLEYLFDTGLTPCDKEQKIWRAEFRKNPFILLRCGALYIKAKTAGFVRFRPWGAQLQIIEHCEWCWERGIPPDCTVVKCRQDGISTLSELILVALEISVGACYSHIVGMIDETCLKMLRIQKTAFERLPVWLRPNFDDAGNRRNDKFLEINAPEVGIDGVQVQTNSSIAREKIGRGDPAQFRHYTECPFYIEQALVFAALSGAKVTAFPSFEIKESSGNRKNDPFHKGYKANRESSDPGVKCFFFGWHIHEEYERPLPTNTNIVEFWEKIQADDPDLFAKFQEHKCTPEKANWYLWKREKELANGMAADLFKREFPFDEDEAFIGGSAQTFKKEVLDAHDSYRKRWTNGRLADIGLTASLRDIPLDWKPKFARCRMVWNSEDKETPPRLEDSPHLGELMVWERARKGHTYIIVVDPAENKLAIPGVLESGDFTVIDVWRQTYDPRCELREMVQVAQLRSRTTPPDEAARYAHALSLLYKSKGSRSSTVIFERNNQGYAFEVAAKRLRTNLFQRYKEVGLTTHFVEHGIQTTRGDGDAAKTSMVVQTRDTYDNGLLRPMSWRTLEEMGDYAKNEKGQYSAPTGLNDDTVSTLYLFCAAVRGMNRDVCAPTAVRADGDVNLADQPDEPEIDEARASAAWEKKKPKTKGNESMIKRRAGGWRGGI